MERLTKAADAVGEALDEALGDLSQKVPCSNNAVELGSK